MYIRIKFSQENFYEIRGKNDCNPRALDRYGTFFGSALENFTITSKISGFFETMYSNSFYISIVLNIIESFSS